MNKLDTDDPEHFDWLVDGLHSTLWPLDALYRHLENHFLEGDLSEIASIMGVLIQEAKQRLHNMGEMLYEMEGDGIALEGTPFGTGYVKAYLRTPGSGMNEEE